MYSLCAKYYDKEFATVDELMNDVMLSGMDNYFFYRAHFLYRSMDNRCFNKLRSGANYRCYFH